MTPISIALCTFNGARFLGPQLDSLGRQSRTPDELVVCDDGSTDGTIALLEAFAQRSPFPVRLHLNAARLGPTANFEQAIRLCRGDIIALCDQDDVWHPDKLLRLTAPFTAPQVGAAFSDAELIDAAGQLLGRRLWAAVGFTPAKQRQARHGTLFSVLVAYNVVTGTTMAFRAAYREQILPIPPIWVHDGWIALVVAALTDVALIAEPLIQYRIHAQQAVGVGPSTPFVALADLWKNPQTYSAKINLACATVADQLAAARDRLMTLPEVRNKQRTLARLSAKIDHLRMRAHLPRRRRARLGMVARELFSARYHRYSLGFRSAARDLIL
jgi:glycosyltransferase involved in cell wall biosynthesis